MKDSVDEVGTSIVSIDKKSIVYRLEGGEIVFLKNIVPSCHWQCVSVFH